MVNRKEKSAKKASATRVPQLNVRPFPEELLRRISAVAGTKGQTQKEFVIEALEKRTIQYKNLVEEIYRREKERENE
jgi:hypothetical protein